MWLRASTRCSCFDLIAVGPRVAVRILRQHSIRYVSNETISALELTRNIGILAHVDAGDNFIAFDVVVCIEANVCRQNHHDRAHAVLFGQGMSISVSKRNLLSDEICTPIKVRAMGNVDDGDTVTDFMDQVIMPDYFH